MNNYRYDFPQYGSRRRLISPVYDEYGEVIVEDDGYYYSPHGPEVLPLLECEFQTFTDYLEYYLKYLF